MLSWRWSRFAAAGYGSTIPRAARRIDRSEFDAAFTGVLAECTVAPSCQRRGAPEHVRPGDLAQRTRGLTQRFALTTPLLGHLVVDEAVPKSGAGLLGVLVIGMAFLLPITTGAGLVQGPGGLCMGTQASIPTGNGSSVPR